MKRHRTLIESNEQEKKEQTDENQKENDKVNSLLDQLGKKKINEEKVVKKKKGTSWLKKLFLMKIRQNDCSKDYFCQLCVNTSAINIKDSSTGNLHNHFKNNHKNIYEDLKYKSEGGFDVENDIKKLIDDKKKENEKSSNFFLKFASNNQKIGNCEKIIDWIKIGILYGISFNFLGSKEIRDHQKKYNNSNYPGRESLVDDYLPAIYMLTVDKVKKILKNVNQITITSDSYSSIVKDKYITITSHFIDENWKMNNVTLGVLRFIESQTIENLKNFIVEVVRDLAPKSNIFSMVVDNGANFKGASKQIAKNQIFCAAHTLQLVINDVLDIDKYKQEIEKVKQLVIKIRNSNTLRNELKFEQQDDDSYDLILDVATRWNSCFFMLKRFLELKKEILNMYEKEQSLKEIDFPNIDKIRMICEILSEFEEATKVLSGENYSTITILPIFVLKLKKILERVEKNQNIEISDFKKELLNSLNSRMGYILDDVNISLKSCCFDPKYGNLCFITQELRNKVRKDLENDLKSILSNEEINNKISKFPNLSIAIDGELKVLRNYFESNQSDCNNILEWWKEFENNGGKNLGKLAKIYLAIPATSTPSERNFSSAGFIHDRRRTKMKSLNVERLLFLRQNYEIIPDNKEIEKYCEKFK